MICRRCRGLMTPERLSDWDGGKGNDRLVVFRCISCGDIIDPVILTNRERCTGASTRRKWPAHHDTSLFRLQVTTPFAAVAPVETGDDRGGMHKRREEL